MHFSNYIFVRDILSLCNPLPSTGLILFHKIANVKFGFNTLPQLNSMGNVTPKKTKFENDSPLIQIKTITLILQRRAILHLKTQKRKIKEKNKSQEDKPPFFDVSCLKSRTVQVSANHNRLKEKDRDKSQEDKPPFFDTSCLKSQTVQVSKKKMKEMLTNRIRKIKLPYLYILGLELYVHLVV